MTRLMQRYVSQALLLGSAVGSLVSAIQCLQTADPRQQAAGSKQQPEGNREQQLPGVLAALFVRHAFSQNLAWR